VSNLQTSAPVVLAKIGAPHGVKGDLKLNILTEDPDFIFTLQEDQDLFSHILISDRPNETSLFHPLSEHAPVELFEKGQGVYIYFDQYADRDLARIFVNRYLALPRDLLPELSSGEQHYWTDLEGLEVLSQSGSNLEAQSEVQSLGTVSHLFETGANDVLVVKAHSGHKEYLIPYVSAHVLKVDLDSKKILVDWDPNF